LSYDNIVLQKRGLDRNAPPQTAVSSVNSNARHKPILFILAILDAASTGTRPVDLPGSTLVLADELEANADESEAFLSLFHGWLPPTLASNLVFLSLAHQQPVPSPRIAAACPEVVKMVLDSWTLDRWFAMRRMLEQGHDQPHACWRSQQAQELRVPHRSLVEKSPMERRCGTPSSRNRFLVLAFRRIIFLLAFKICSPRYHPPTVRNRTVPKNPLPVNDAHSTDKMSMKLRSDETRPICLCCHPDEFTIVVFALFDDSPFFTPTAAKTSFLAAIKASFWRVVARLIGSPLALYCCSLDLVD
ncbi:hypothetical protein KCU74_g78, partial [Aureobasidium melanogenum]